MVGHAWYYLCLSSRPTRNGIPSTSPHRISRLNRTVPVRATTTIRCGCRAFNRHHPANHHCDGCRNAHRCWHQHSRYSPHTRYRHHDGYSRSHRHTVTTNTVPYRGTTRVRVTQALPSSAVTLLFTSFREAFRSATGRAAALGSPPAASQPFGLTLQPRPLAVTTHSV